MDVYQQIVKNAADKYVLLLLVEEGAPAAKEATQKLVAHVIQELTVEDGPLDEELQAFDCERPSRVVYQRLALDRNNQEMLAKAGISWLPQVRLIRKSRMLFRSAVQMGDNGNFLATDVGGKSFRRHPDEPFLNLFDALDKVVK